MAGGWACEAGRWRLQRGGGSRQSVAEGGRGRPCCRVAPAIGLRQGGLASRTPGLFIWWDVPPPRGPCARGSACGAYVSPHACPPAPAPARRRRPQAWRAEDAKQGATCQRGVRRCLRCRRAHQARGGVLLLPRGAPPSVGRGSPPTQSITARGLCPQAAHARLLGRQMTLDILRIFFYFFFPLCPSLHQRGACPPPLGLGLCRLVAAMGRPEMPEKPWHVARARTHTCTHAPPREWGLFQGTLLAGVGERQAVHRQHGERGAGDACRGTYERAVGHTRGSSGGNTRRQRVPLRPPPPPVSASVSALCFCVALSLCPRLTFRCSAGPLAPSLHTP